MRLSEIYYNIAEAIDSLLEATWTSKPSLSGYHAGKSVSDSFQVYSGENHDEVINCVRNTGVQSARWNVILSQEFADLDDQGKSDTFKQLIDTLLELSERTILKYAIHAEINRADERDYTASKEEREAKNQERQEAAEQAVENIGTFVVQNKDEFDVLTQINDLKSAGWLRDIGEDVYKVEVGKSGQSYATPTMSTRSALKHKKPLEEIPISAKLSQLMSIWKSTNKGKRWPEFEQLLEKLLMHSPKIGIKGRGQISDEAFRSFAAAMQYHAEAMSGQRWPALERAILSRSHTFTRPGIGGMEARPRMSVFRYLNTINDRWLEGEELVTHLIDKAKHNVHATGKVLASAAAVEFLVKHEIKIDSLVKYAQEVIESIIKNINIRPEYSKYDITHTKQQLSVPSAGGNAIRYLRAFGESLPEKFPEALQKLGMGQ